MTVSDPGRSHHPLVDIPRPRHEFTESDQILKSTVSQRCQHMSRQDSIGESGILSEMVGHQDANLTGQRQEEPDLMPRWVAT